MRFSVLLPTRGGGQIVGACLDSILTAAEGHDVEVIVSDNANDDATPQVLAGYADDDRVRVLRQDDLLDVTGNWNATVTAASGDYLLMMGDDDAILPDGLTQLADAVERLGHPDCLTCNAYSFVAPGAIAGLEVAHYGDPHFDFGPAFTAEREIPVGERRAIVAEMFRYRPGIPLNMQTTLVARQAYAQLPSPPFRAPFPDHYALNAMMLTVPHWSFSAIRPTVVGVSAKSFGHHVYSHRQAAGLSYLGIQTGFDGRLPGNELLNAMTIWLRLLQREFPEELRKVEISRGDYVIRQMHSWYQQAQVGALAPRTALARVARLSNRDLAAALGVILDVHNLRRLRRVSSASSHAERLWHGLRPVPEVDSISAFLRWVDARNASPASS